MSEQRDFDFFLALLAAALFGLMMWAIVVWLFWP
jgi:hypothetical protein